MSYFLLCINFVIICMHVYNLYMRIEQIEVSKGPSYREQNNIDWQINYAEAVKEYKQNSDNKESVDSNLLDEWEGTVLSLLKKALKN